MKKLLALLVFLPSLALAANTQTPVQQSGTATTGDIVKFLGNGKIGDSGIPYTAVPTLSGSAFTSTSVNGVTLTTGGSSSQFLNAAGSYVPHPAPPVTTVSTSGSSQSISFPSSGNAAYDITLTANCAITLTGGTSGQYQSVTLILRQNSTAGWTPTLPSGVKWSGGTTPTPNTQAGKIDVFTFSTPDAGTTVLGSY